jgi:hypothetical protein
VGFWVVMVVVAVEGCNGGREFHLSGEWDTTIVGYLSHRDSRTIDLFHPGTPHTRATFHCCYSFLKRKQGNKKKEMRILSFDIGVRNLSFCMIRVQGDQWDTVHIEEWQVIDVLTESDCQVKNSKTIPIDKCIQFVTRVLHQRRDIWGKEPIDHIVIERQMKKAPRNVGLSIAVQCYFLNYYLNANRKKEKSERKRESKANPQENSEPGAREIIIVSDDDDECNEDQEDEEEEVKSDNHTTVPKITFIAAKNKLQVNIKEGPFAYTSDHQREYHYTKDTTLTAAQNKTRRKNKAIELTRLILEKRVSSSEKKQWLPVFQKHKKRDDLSDCYLQALWYLQDKLGKKPKKVKVVQVQSAKRKRKETVTIPRVPKKQKT